MKIGRILAPIDFSADSLAALQEADALAVEQGAKLTILHVHSPVAAAFMDLTYREPPEKLAEAVTAIDEKLQEWAGSLRTPAERRDVRVVVGVPVSEIVRESEQHDLLVISTHGRTGLTHFLMGSIAERVVRAALCSVLVVKKKAA